MKTILITWLVIGGLAAGGYFFPPVRRFLKNGEANALLQQCRSAQDEAASIHVAKLSSDAEKAKMNGLWDESLAKCHAAFRELVPAEANTLTSVQNTNVQELSEACAAALGKLAPAEADTLANLQVAQARALMNTGMADCSYRSLTALAAAAENTGRLGSETRKNVNAAVAEASYQIALMIRAQDNVDDHWVKHAEKSIATYQDLLVNTPGEPEKGLLQQNLACVTTFLFSPQSGDRSLGMPGKATENCPRKMKQLEREPPPRNRPDRSKRFQKPQDDKTDPIRQPAIQQTESGGDEGQ